jgi:adenine-specific DNA-methyltransferase
MPPRRRTQSQINAQLEAARGEDALRPPTGPISISGKWDKSSEIVIHSGDCLDLLKSMPNESVKLIVTSPPYNIGKAYEKKSPLDVYLDVQSKILAECARVIQPGGSIVWQVGNYIDKKTGEVIPLDALFFPILKNLGLSSRNRIIWTFDHGLHASRRFSGRHETMLWFSKGNDYAFSLDPVRVPQKYPNKKYFKGPKRGELSGNPNGKNPGDVWAIPNVKHNHPEKTIHPCSFPIELVERFVLSLTEPGDVVLDPFGGVGSTIVAAVLHGRRGVMAEMDKSYIKGARERLKRAERGELLARPMGKPIHGSDSK